MTLSRRQTLAVLAGGAAALAAFPARADCPRPGTLAAAACAKNITFGAAVAMSGLTARSPYRDLVLRECSAIVPEWEMKWAQVQRSPGVFDFSVCDRLAHFASSNGLALRGHTLVWHLGMPDWLPRALDGRSWAPLLQRHVQALCERYPLPSWDVVNEAVEPDHGRGDGLRESPWLKAAGFDYIRTAFQLAARYAPRAQLVYNDYGTEHDAPWTRKRRLAILKLLERLRKADAPVHAFGMQSHLKVGDPFSEKALTAFLREVQALGLKPLITELDVDGHRIRAVPDRDREVAALYRAYLETVLGNSDCDVVMTWGLGDSASWLTRENPGARPLPFDSLLRPKPAYDAIMAAMTAARRRAA